MPHELLRQPDPNFALNATLKADIMRNKRIPAFHRLVTHNRWAFVELRSLHDFGEEFGAGIESFPADAEAA